MLTPYYDDHKYHESEILKTLFMPCRRADFQPFNFILPTKIINSNKWMNNVDVKRSKHARAGKKVSGFTTNFLVYKIHVLRAGLLLIAQLLQLKNYLDRQRFYHQQ